MNRTNANTETRITLTDGTTWVEKHRAAFGGFCNMLDRVADKIDGTNSPRPVEVGEGGHATYETRGGAGFAIGPVLTEADRVA